MKAAALATAALLTGIAARLLIAHSLMAAALAIATVASGLAALTAYAGQDSRFARLATPGLFGLLLLWLWEMLVTGLAIPVVLLPAPAAIAAALVAHAAELKGDFITTVVDAMLPGYLIGCAAGFALALAADRSDYLRRGLLPIGNLMSAMPIVGIAPIMVMWFGFGWQSKAAVVVLMTIFPMLVNTSAGLAEAGALDRDLMHSYAAGYRRTLLKLRLPAALPHIFNALKLNTTLALIGAVVAEFFGSPVSGMGFRIATEAARLNLDIVWAAITIAALTGSASFGAIALIERRVTFWHPSIRN